MLFEKFAKIRCMQKISVLQ